MIKTSVARNDSIYECFPDIARAPDGTLVCINRESMMHAPFPFSRIVVRRSFDEGANWAEREILIECVPTPEALDAQRSWIEPDAIAGYEQTLARIPDDWQIGCSINCPRLLCLTDGTLLLVADFYHADQEDGQRWKNRIWRSADSGESWDGPELMDVPDGLVPSITQLRSGEIWLGLVTQSRDPGHDVSFILRSTDAGRTWSEPTYIPYTDQFEIDEVSYVELDDGAIVGFGRNVACERAHVPSAAPKVISHDGGHTWSGPFPTWLMGCEGRPKAGLLASGEICITYRCDLPNEQLAMHVMTQDAAGSEELGQRTERRPLPEDIPGEEARARGEERPWYMTHYYPGRTIILDYDRSVHRDNGYSGWVQLSNGDIFVVDYIHDDAPLAQIRGYRVSRSDIIMFPDGDLPSLHPSWQPFRAITRSLARAQMEANAAKRKTNTP